MFLSFYETYPRNALLETFAAAQDVDLDAQKVEGHVAPVQLGDPDRVLFGGDDHFGPGGLGLIDEVDDLLLGVAVVVGVVVGEDQLRPQFPQKALETGRAGDGAQGGGLHALQTLQRLVLLRKELLEVLGLVAAFDDLRLAAVAGKKALQIPAPGTCAATRPAGY